MQWITLSKFKYTYFMKKLKLHKFYLLSFRKFIKICQEALELNGRLITSDQYEYHSSMKKNFQEFVDSLSGMLHEKVFNLLIYSF